MDCKIKVNKRFNINAAKTYEYISEEWGFKVADEFHQKIKVKFNLLRKQPHAGIPSKKRKNIRSVLVAKHNRLYYRVKGSLITIINILDTRIDPNRNPYK
jgi:plasmid stabilization system protein ParE